MHKARPRTSMAASLLLGVVAACAPPGPAQPNVLLVSIDTLRADHLHCYGYERETSPALDRLSAEGVLFERALATSSWTLPSHISMLTGLPVSAHGVCDDRLWTLTGPDGELLPVPLKGRFVSESLVASGYRTAGLYTWKYLEPQFGFGPGFETWERLGHTFYSHPEVGPRFEALQLAGDAEGMRALAGEFPELFDDRRPSSAETVDRAIEWLEERERSRPFFLFVHLFDVHDPYTPPAPYDTLFDPDYRGAIDGRRVTSPDSPVRGDMPARDLAHLVALYDGEIAWVDSQVGRLIERLDALDLAEETLVIVTSDHGEEFFEHGHKTHRRQLYMESVHVPMILRWPGRLPAGERVAAPVGLADLSPTILAAAGLPPGPTFGRDLVPLALDPESAPPRTVVSELQLFDGQPAPERHLGLLRDDGYALMRARGRSDWEAETFDLARNPSGAGRGAAPPDARSQGPPAELREALSALRAWLPARAEQLPELSEHDLRQLAAMGYSGDRTTTPGAERERLCLDGCVFPDE